MLASPATGVVITGAAPGIGLATAHALAAVGRPVSLWDINAGRRQGGGGSNHRASWRGRFRPDDGSARSASSDTGGARDA